MVFAQVMCASGFYIQFTHVLKESYLFKQVSFIPLHSSRLILYINPADVYGLICGKTT